MDPHTSDSDDDGDSNLDPLPPVLSAAINRCGKAREAERWARADRLEHYQSIIKGLSADNFNENSELTYDFLLKFTCEEISPLIISFIQDEVPGEGNNTWSQWAERNPPHNEVEYATLWTFWLSRLLPKGLKNWEKADEWRANTSNEFLDTFLATDVDLLFKEWTLGTVPPNNWNTWTTTYSNHTSSQWNQFWDLWLSPLLRLSKPTPASASDNGPEILEKEAIPKMTPLARKFGPSVHFQFQVTGKEGHTIPRSGLTPTEPPLGGPVQTSLEYEKQMEYVRYQQMYIERHLSLKDLHMAEVLSEKQSVKQANLTNEIIPLLARNSWLCTATDLMPDRRRWNVRKYDDLWEAMVPSLRLASKLLTECHAETWWDDLAKALDTREKQLEAPGNLVPISSDYKGITGHYFKRTDPSVRFYEKRIDWLFLASHITFRIKRSGDCNASGVTWIDRKSSKDENGNIPRDPNAIHVAILIDSDEMIPLMNQGDKKMSEAEKLIHNFHIAEIIAHEVCHAIYFIFCPFQQIHPDTERGQSAEIREQIREQMAPFADEPYYENEDFSELGWSMENAVFGGATYPLLPDPREGSIKEEEDLLRQGFPQIGFNIVPAMTFENFEFFPCRKNDEQWLIHQQEYLVSPIPLYYYEEIQQDEFWNVYTRVYGGELLKPRPLLSVRHNRLRNMETETAIVARINYTELLAKMMDLNNGQGWWWSDKAKFNDPVAQAYVRRRLEREKSVALRIQLSGLEKGRHEAIRRLKETPLEARKLKNYKKLRKQLKATYDKKRLEAYQQQGLETAAGDLKIDDKV